MHKLEFPLGTVVTVEGSRVTIKFDTCEHAAALIDFIRYLDTVEEMPEIIATRLNRPVQ